MQTFDRKIYTCISFISSLFNFKDKRLLKYNYKLLILLFAFHVNYFTVLRICVGKFYVYQRPFIKTVPCHFCEMLMNGNVQLRYRYEYGPLVLLFL